MASNCIHYFKRISCLPRPINKVITQFIQVKGILSQSSTSLEKAQYEVTCRYAASLPILPLPLGPAISDREKEAFLTYSLSFPLSDPKVVTRMRLLRADKSSSRSRAKKVIIYFFLSFYQYKREMNIDGRIMPKHTHTLYIFQSNRRKDSS